jgi:hypothetical protein
MIIHRLSVLAAVLLVCCVFPRPAHAYLDAGTGSMILQIILASSAAALFILKTQWRRIKAKLFGSSLEAGGPQPDLESGTHDGGDGDE